MRYVNCHFRTALCVFLFATLTVSAFAQEEVTDSATTATSETGSPLSFVPTLWDLAVQGGWFMIPIALSSVVTIAFTLERLYALRTGRVMPRRLIRKLRDIVNDHRANPRLLWDVCQDHDSPLANAIRAAVLKAGRPLAEVEKTVEDAVARETGIMTRNLRPINVVASIAPLLGLLGTVQGMIMAFMVTSTTSSTGTAKAQELAHGIYTALITTFAGLCVAVVSVILVNWLEGRIERILEKMEGIFLDLLPHFERYSNRVRVTESRDAPGTITIQTSRTESENASVAERRHTSAARPTEAITGEHRG